MTSALTLGGVLIGNVRAFPADLSWRGSNALFSCFVGTRCSYTCPYAATHHVDGTQLAASGGLGPVPQMYPRDASASRPEACCPGTSALSFAPRTQRMHGCSCVCPYDATRRVDSTQLAASGGLEPVPQMLMHAAGRTYPAVSSWRISGKRCSCADSRDAMEAARSWLHRGHVLLLCMSV